MAAWTNPFLNALREHGVVAQACRDAGVTSSVVYNRRREDADFAAAWDNALEDACDALELEARRRAVQGVEEPVVHQGQLTPVWERDENGEIVYDVAQVPVWVPGKDGEPGEWVDMPERRMRQARNPDGSLKWLTVRKPSDSLLMFVLKGRRREVFGTERTELTGRDGAPLQVADATKRTARMAALLALATRRKDSNVDDLV